MPDGSGVVWSVGPNLELMTAVRVETVAVSSLNLLCRFLDKRVLAVCISERLVWRVFICVFNKACLLATVEMMVVMCSSRTENDSSSVLREEVLVAFDVVTIL